MPNIFKSLLKKQNDPQKEAAAQGIDYLRIASILKTDKHTLEQFETAYAQLALSQITWTVNDRKTPDEVKEHFRNHPDEEMCVADYTFILPASRVLNDVAYNKATVRVLASGSMRQCGNTEYPYGKRLVMMDCAAGHKECAYPFECDALCEALEKDDNIKTLFNYIHYINT